MLDGKLHLAPLENPQRILDVGTGTGVWAIDIADTFPAAEVIGVDIAPIQPNYVVRNVRFEIGMSMSHHISLVSHLTVSW